MIAEQQCPAGRGQSQELASGPSGTQGKIKSDCNGWIMRSSLTHPPGSACPWVRPPPECTWWVIREIHWTNMHEQMRRNRHVKEASLSQVYKYHLLSSACEIDQTTVFLNQPLVSHFFKKHRAVCLCLLCLGCRKLMKFNNVLKRVLVASSQIWIIFRRLMKLLCWYPLVCSGVMCGFDCFKTVRVCVHSLLCVNCKYCLIINV